MGYVRSCDGMSAVEKLIFCKPIKLRATSLALFNTLNDFVNEANIKWQNCTDGARTLSGRLQSLQTHAKQKSSQCGRIHFVQIWNCGVEM